MRRGVSTNRDVVSGCLFLVLGAATVVYAQRYKLGSLTEMGAGYFPIILGGLMMLSGAGVALAGLLSRETAPIARPDIRPLLAICASVICFALLLDDIGLPLSVFATVIVACAARPGFFRPSVFVLAAALAVVCVLIFVELLNVPIRLLPAIWQGF